MTSIVPIRLSLSNAYLVRGERAILVDTGSAKDGRRILATLHQQGVPDPELALILHTHGHGDHCGSTRQLQEVTSAPAAVHSGDAEMLTTGQMRPTVPRALTARFLHLLVDASFPAVRPDIIFEDELNLQPFGIAGRIVLTPGHTAGSISLLLDTGDAIVGDLLMGGYLGGMILPGRPNYPYFADDLEQLRASVAKLLEMGVNRFFVGHGGPLPAERVRRWLARQQRKASSR